MIEVRLESVRFAAEGVSLFAFTAPNGGALADVPAGSTLRLELPNGVKRTYFIAERTRRGGYLIGVRRDPDGSGSKYLHDRVRVGARLRLAIDAAERPDLRARRSIVVAEDVGIFGAWSLLRAFDARGSAWSLHYDAWSPSAAPLLDALRAYGSRVAVRFRSERHGASLDWDAIASDVDDETCVYAFVSESSYAALGAALASRGLDGPTRIRWTNLVEPPPRGPVEFDVVLARRNLTVPVREDETILAALRGAGIEVPYFCAAGICGTCRTRVLDGVPLHLDAVLDGAERASNAVMMICRSRALGARLVLDI